MTSQRAPGLRTSGLRTTGLRTTGLLAAFVLVGAGCQDIVDQLDSDVIAMAALIRTPDMTVPAPTALNPNATRNEPGSTVLNVFFGTLDKRKITTAVTGDVESAQAGAFVPAVGAIVTLDYADCTACPIGLSDDGEGRYSVDQDTAQALEYKQTKYTLTVKYSGDVYKLAVDAPAPVVIDEFHAENTEHKTVWGHPPGDAFTVTRREPVAPTRRPIAFAAAKALDDAAQDPWTSVPTEPVDLLNLLLDDEAYRARSFDVPGSVFREDSSYLVTLAAAERGGQPDDDATLDLLFAASSFIAGVADGGVVSTRSRPVLP